MSEASELVVEAGKHKLGLHNYCAFCDGRWPCLPRRLADYLQRLTDEGINA